MIILLDERVVANCDLMNMHPENRVRVPTLVMLTGEAATGVENQLSLQQE